jgi:hypothetical protein
MQKLHKGSSENLAPEEEQPTPLCSNKDAAGCSSLGYKRRFKESDTKSLLEVALILKRAHIRLIMEGYTIENGIITPPVKTNHVRR